MARTRPAPTGPSPAAATSPTDPGRRRFQQRLGAAGLLAAPAARALGLLNAPAAVPLVAIAAHARAADIPRFGLGVASGHPRPHQLVLWTRLTGPGLADAVAVRWELADDARFERLVASGETHALADEAHSVHAEPQGLAPGCWYHYRFIALGQQSPHGRTRTAPGPDRPATLKLALASCQRLEHGRWAAWQHAAEAGHDLVLFAGDYIYEYPLRAGAAGLDHALPEARSLADYRERYALYKSDPALQAAHAACPWVPIWDDHEVENDHAADAGPSGGGAEFAARRTAAYRAWWEHQPVPRALKPGGPALALYGWLNWGRLARILALDNRQYRSPQACPSRPGAVGSQVLNAADCAELSDPDRSLLGSAQEAWLARSWDPDRPWNLLLQTTLMARLSRQPIQGPNSGRYWTDGWDGYPAARQRLLQGAVAGGARNLVVLGGDVHSHIVADLVVDPDRPDGPVVASEFCSTSIASRGPMQAGLDVARLINPHLHHARSDERGYVSLTVDAQRASASLIGVDRPMDRDSPCHVQARFEVAAGRPGVQPG